MGRSVAQDLEDNESLPSTLGSYRRGKETWMNAAVLASDIYDGFERGEETLVVALDLEDAYNRVRYDVLLRTMVRMGVRPQLIIWIGEALLKRSVALRIGTWTSERRTITPGLPKGSALSPCALQYLHSRHHFKSVGGSGTHSEFCRRCHSVQARHD